MLSASIPAKFPIPWAKAAAAPDIRPIPQASQIGIQAGAASLTDGFPPVCFLPIGGGGTPAFGADFNGILQQLSLWSQWLGSGMFAQPFDSSYSTSIGGYPKGAVLQAASLAFGYYWISQVDSNTSNPDTGGANWQPFSLLGFTTGDVKTSFKNIVDPGWVIMNDGSIGNASSGSTTRANADTAALFTLLYNNVADSYAPIQTSSGTGTTRAAQGAAATAYAANCRLVLPLTLGRAIASAGSGAGLTSRPLGASTGEESHLLSIAEMPSHNHPQESDTDLGQQSIQAGQGSGGTTFLSQGGTTQNTGGGGSHNNMQPTTFQNVMIRL